MKKRGLCMNDAQDRDKSVEKMLQKSGRARLTEKKPCHQDITEKKTEDVFTKSISAI